MLFVLFCCVVLCYVYFCYLALTVRIFLPSNSYNSNVFQLPEGRMLTYFNIVPEGSILDVPNAGKILLSHNTSTLNVVVFNWHFFPSK